MCEISVFILICLILRKYFLSHFIPYISLLIFHLHSIAFELCFPIHWTAESLSRCTLRKAGILFLRLLFLTGLTVQIISTSFRNVVSTIW